MVQSLAPGSGHQVEGRPAEPAGVQWLDHTTWRQLGEEVTMHNTGNQAFSVDITIKTAPITWE